VVDVVAYGATSNQDCKRLLNRFRLKSKSIKMLLWGLKPDLVRTWRSSRRKGAKNSSHHNPHRLFHIVFLLHLMNDQNDLVNAMKSGFSSADMLANLLGRSGRGVLVQICEKTSSTKEEEHFGKLQQTKCK